MSVWQVEKLSLQGNTDLRFWEGGIRLPFGITWKETLYLGVGPSAQVLSDGQARGKGTTNNGFIPYRFFRKVDAGVYGEVAWLHRTGWGLKGGVYHGLVNLSEVVPLQVRQLRWELSLQKGF